MLLVYCWVSHHLISAGRCYSFTRSISIHALRWNKIRFHATSSNANDKNKDQQSDKLQYDANERSSRPPIIPFDFIREDIIPKATKSKNETDVKTATGDDKTPTASSDASRETARRPPIIPFDFIREDIRPKRVLVDDSNKNQQLVPGGKTTKTAVNTRYDDRPSGYDIPDEDDDAGDAAVVSYDENSNGSLDNVIFKIFKDIYIGSPYDSRKKQQARYVITNITVISILIGAVFTATWYLFPGKFISFRGDADLSSRYTDTYKYIDPSDLLNNNGPSIYFNDDGTSDDTTDSVKSMSEATDEYLDSAVGLPEKKVTRFAPPVAKPNLAPGRAVDL